MNHIADFVRENGLSICWHRMNMERLDAAIRLMESVPEENFYIPMWQGNTHDLHTIYKGQWEPKKTPEEIHACGTTACFGGWLAVSKEWREAGGDSLCGLMAGAPHFPGGRIDPRTAVVTYFFGEDCYGANKLFASMMYINQRDRFYAPYLDKQELTTIGDIRSGRSIKPRHVAAALKDVRRIVVAAKRKCKN